MSEKKPINEGFQPIEKKGHQPSTDKLNIIGGFQPTTSENKPITPPPKKP